MTIAIVSVACLALASAVVAQQAPLTPGKAELTDAGISWPHEVTAPEPVYAGKSMAVLLTEIHEKALVEWAAAPPEMKPTIRDVISRAVACLAYDGNAPVGEPMPSHAARTPTVPSHLRPKAKVLPPYAAAFPPPPPPPAPPPPADWAKVAAELDHGH